MQVSIENCIERQILRQIEQFPTRAAALLLRIVQRCSMLQNGFDGYDMKVVQMQLDKWLQQHQQSSKLYFSNKPELVPIFKPSCLSCVCC